MNTESPNILFFINEVSGIKGKKKETDMKASLYLNLASFFGSDATGLQGDDEGEFGLDPHLDLLLHREEPRPQLQGGLVAQDNL